MWTGEIVSKVPTVQARGPNLESQKAHTKVLMLSCFPAACSPGAGDGFLNLTAEQTKSMIFVALRDPVSKIKCGQSLQKDTTPSTSALFVHTCTHVSNYTLHVQ